MKLSIIFLFLLLIYCCKADTPADCRYEDIKGEWILYESSRNGNNQIFCNGSEIIAESTKVSLDYPNIAIDENGHKGTWTLIYNQGFEVLINYRKFFAFSYYEINGATVISYCNETFIGWSHDILGHNWACYRAKKVSLVKPKISYTNNKLKSGIFQQDRDFINLINNYQQDWKAQYYEQFEGKLYSDMMRMFGGSKATFKSPPLAPSDEKIKKIADSLPNSFDWRNVDGINYVSPVREQGICGSCYIFSSIGMIESRLRIMTNNTFKPTLSPQNILDCSQYSQGCEGGFPYLIAGKYAQDFGFIEEQCDTYKKRRLSCKKTNCNRIYTAEYSYVGGYYGGCNEDLMKIALVTRGPLSVSFEVYNDFVNYKSGIYQHIPENMISTNLTFKPFAVVNHAVLLVGYGEKDGKKYWIVKNSWGKDWGDEGFFKILRGVNECNIETIALEATPIP